MKNPSDATLALLSILKYSKIRNGRQMAGNIAKINIIHVKQKAHFSYCPYCLLLVHQTMAVQKQHHELFEKKKSKIKMASKMVDINKKTASQSCTYSMFCVLNAHFMFILTETP